MNESDNIHIIRNFQTMGNNFSTSEYSNDGRWVSVAKWDNKLRFNPDNKKDNWYMLNDNIFDGLDDNDMNQITSIMSAKKSDRINDKWFIDNNIIRVVDIKWRSEVKAYTYKVSTNLHNRVDKISYPYNKMYRLAIHKEALENYKMTKNGDKGTLFHKMAKEISSFQTPFEQITRKIYGYIIQKIIFYLNYKVQLLE